MSTRFLTTVTLTFLIGGMLAGCFSVMGNEPAPEANKRGATVNPGPVVVVQPQPYLKNQIFFKMDETAPASATQSQHRNVVTWRLKVDSDLKWQHFINGLDERFDVDARIWGWDAAGNQVASGRVHIDWDDMFGWYSTVQVEGQRLDIEQAGLLMELIVQDIDADGPGKSAGAELEKAPCWLKFIGAAAAVSAFVAVSGVALTACGSLGGPVALAACIGALINQGLGGGVLAGAVLNWLCDCWEGYRELNPELCEGF